MALLYTDEEGARVCVYEYDPEENIYEEKNRLLYLFVKFDGDDETLLHLEASLKETAQALKIDYVGWRLFEGWLEFYFYAEDAKGVESAFNTLLKPQYQCEFGQRKDKKYETYKNLLLPNDFEYHQLQSEEIIAELEEAEEDLQMPREIEFYAMFMTMSQRERFTQAVADKSFSVSNEFIDENAEDDFVYGVVFTKSSSISLETLNALSQEFLPLIQKEHGRYEGWGTEATA
jgi:regulator of RNase E activity RraB